MGKRAPNGELEDIDDEEIIQAYDNINLSASALDNTSQKSGRYVVPGGNGNPNKLPGIPMDHPGRKISTAQNLGERNNSVGSASVGRVKNVQYPETNMKRAGSSSLILDDDVGKT